jgi:hypothetical protein
MSQRRFGLYFAPNVRRIQKTYDPKLDKPEPKVGFLLVGMEAIEIMPCTVAPEKCCASCAGFKK